MDWGRPRVGKNRNVFKGTVLVSTLLENYPKRFRSRAVAVKFSKRLFKEGLVRSIFGARTFEDSAQLFMWQDDDAIKTHRGMITSSYAGNNPQEYGAPREPRSDRLDYRLVEDVKNKVLNRADNNQYNIVSSFNNFIRELERDFPEASHQRKSEHYQRYPPSSWETGIKRESTCSTDSSVDTQTYFKHRERTAYRHAHQMSTTRDHSVIPEELPLGKPDIAATLEYEMNPGMPGTINSHASSGGTMESSDSHRRWPEPSYSYSDNEKQLIEEMKRMKKEHHHILRSYEERINKLMAKMHELRSIAEMLENSSTKSSPYGILPPKASLLNIIGSKLEEERKQAVALAQDGGLPPPLPPRPIRGNKVYPNKPIVHPQVKMRTLHWHRIILTDVGSESGTVWHNMLEPQLDRDDIERLFSKSSDATSADEITLYDDVYFRRGRPKQQTIGIFDSDKSQRVTLEMKKLRHPLSDILQVFSTLDSSTVHKDGLADLLELLHSPRDLDKIHHHIKRKGASNLDLPEYLVFELSKIDHFRERIEFLRFKHRLQINLFEIDQQLRELNTACDEIVNSVSLKNLLETVLCIGNYLNGGSSERGQADGFTLDILTKMKDFSDKTKRGNLLECLLKTYVQQYENDLDLGCPTRFRLPEPSNMRHAAQVSFDDMHRVLSELRTDVINIRERIESLSRRENSNLTQTLRINSDNFASCALEVVFEQERVLEDCKNRFIKTTAYFLFDNRKCTPQEFFGIWATFLHDCKYYWKLAHRNLARNKFELDFKSKSQMSSSSGGQGFNSIKSKMLKHLSVLNDDKDLKVNRAQHLKHINNWIESVGKYTLDLNGDRPVPAPREVDDNKEVARYTQNQQRSQSPSPKPMTSTPPNVHKPLAITKPSPETVEQTQNPVPSERTANYENQPRYTANYENGDQAYESLNKARMNHVNSAPPIPAKPSQQSQDPKKAGAFSLKSWLKRDQRVDDEQSQNPSQNSVQSNGSKTTGASGNPFGKLRNTVVQKLTNGNSAKKTPENQTDIPKRRERESSRDRWAQYDQETSERKQRDRQSRKEDAMRYDGERRDGEQIRHPGTKPPIPDPVQIFQDKLNRDYQNYNFDSPVPRSSSQHGVSSSVPSTLSSTRSRDLSPSKYEMSRAHRDRHGSGTRHVQPDQIKPGANNDENNNKNTNKVSPQSATPYNPRNRAPILLGSNMSISDAYGRSQEDVAAGHNPVMNGDAADVAMGQVNNVDSKWVKATAVPVYKAKLIPNYENQTKLDPRFDGQGIRGQAEAVPFHLHQESSTSDDYRQVLMKKSELYVSPTYGSVPGKQMTPDPPRPSRSHKDTRRSVSAGNLQERHTQEHMQHRDDYPVHPASDRRPVQHKPSSRDPREAQGPANAPSITSLIERFEKKDDLPTTQDVPWSIDSLGRPVEKPVSMSTPVTRRRNIPHSEDPQTPSRPDRSRYHDHPSPKQAHVAPTQAHVTPNQAHVIPNQQAHQAHVTPSQQAHQAHVTPSQAHVTPNQTHATPNQAHVTPSHSHHNSIYAHQHTPSSQYSYQCTPGSIPPPKPAHTPQYRPERNDSNYSDQLRQTAKSSSVFDRYTKPTTPGYGRHTSPGATAVVKPTVVHQGAVTFMAI